MIRSRVSTGTAEVWRRFSTSVFVQRRFVQIAATRHRAVSVIDLVVTPENTSFPTWEDRGGSTKTNSMPPLQKSIQKLREDNPNCVLLIQVGSFYELYGDQAQEYAPKLGLKVALKRTRMNDSDGISMAGFPIYQLEKYVTMLVHENEETVAIIDQIGEKKLGDSLVLRRVSRIVTPGTLIDETFLNYNKNNYLLALALPKQLAVSGEHADPDTTVGLAWADLSLGEFNIQETTLKDLMSDIARISPSEIVISKEFQQLHEVMSHDSLQELRRYFVRYHNYQGDSSLFNLATNFKIEKLSLKRRMGLLTLKQTTAMKMVLSYIAVNLPECNPVFDFPKTHWNNQALQMDPRTREALELSSRTTADGKISQTATLLSTIRKTRTQLGSRMLLQWISAPLLDIEELTKRQDFVELFQKNNILSLKIRTQLDSTGDFARSVQQLSLGSGDSLNHIMLIGEGLSQGSIIRDILYDGVPEKYSELIKTFDMKSLDGMANKIFSIVDERLRNDRDKFTDQSSNDIQTPAPKKDDQKDTRERRSFFIQKNHTEELMEAHDSLAQCFKERREIFNDFATKTSDLQLDISKKEEYLKHTDIIHFSGTAANIDAAIEALSIQPHEIQERRPRTLVVKTSAWMQVHLRIDLYILRIDSLEREIISRLRLEILEEIQTIREIGRQLDFLDVTASFAVLASEKNLVRPIFTRRNTLEVKQGRHLVVENGLESSGDLFTPNDTKLGGKTNRLWVISGPNMGGKSTFLRQNAIIVILAQIGSFVPATHCKMGIVDRIFTRIGALDDISRDLSTFMVEMVETSGILENATTKSLAIVDEIGRGTSGDEGLAIAYASLEQLLLVNKCRTLFATHYGIELDRLLTEDGKDKSAVEYFQTGVLESSENRFIADHKLRPGISERSYAIEVAKMAGFPSRAIKSAERAIGLIKKRNGL